VLWEHTGETTDCLINTLGDASGDMKLAAPRVFPFKAGSASNESTEKAQLCSPPNP